MENMPENSAAHPYRGATLYSGGPVGGTCAVAIDGKTKRNKTVDLSRGKSLSNNYQSDR